MLIEEHGVAGWQWTIQGRQGRPKFAQGDSKCGEAVEVAISVL